MYLTSKKIFMDTKLFNIAASLAAWFTGCADERDNWQIEDWKHENPGHKQLFEKLAERENYERNREELDKFSSEEVWKNVEKQLENEKDKKMWYPGLWKYAAVLVIGLTVGLLYWNLNRPLKVETTVVTSAIQAGFKGARLTLGNGKVVEMIPGKSFTISESDGTLIQKDLAGVDYQRGDTIISAEVWNQMETLTGMEYSLILADGTHVYLNAETKLKYPVAFRGEQRIVELSGEAYFKVAKDVAHPFIVKMNGVEVEVLGTSFNARAYVGEDKVTTTLVEGRVVMNGKKIIPGEQAEYIRNSGEIFVKKVDVSQFIAWQTGRFVFRNERLEDVMKTLARWYGVEYHFLDEDAKEVRIGASFGRYDDMSPIMDMLKRTGLVDILQTNRSIYISAKN